MWAALRSRLLQPSPPSLLNQQWKLGFAGLGRCLSTSGAESVGDRGLLDLQEVEKVLSDVKADDVRVIPAGKHFDWADYMVVATGRSTWHVKNIAQALIYKAKQKQKGARHIILPSVEGQDSGKWIVVDSGKVIVHALDEKARAYYDLENLWTAEPPQKESKQDLDKAFVKIRPKNNSKKPAKIST
ncbi:protein Iojap-related, mitochondrial [Punica granatum]|uniref:Uncharacterized protein n=2 Tax=Punica granatum TaxID=22663 RepID=A0A2I0LCC7_PUNGR|nr:protein Iojap-related, mitochondrial [Punica granatum]PKI78340.1 hypothetical protein CRG98_001283 [Punica granatum]